MSNHIVSFWTQFRQDKKKKKKKAQVIFLKQYHYLLTFQWYKYLKLTLNLIWKGRPKKKKKKKEEEEEKEEEVIAFSLGAQDLYHKN